MYQTICTLDNHYMCVRGSEGKQERVRESVSSKRHRVTLLLYYDRSKYLYNKDTHPVVKNNQRKEKKRWSGTIMERK